MPATTAPDVIALADLEAAINYWRQRQPAGETALAPPLDALAGVYGQAVFARAAHVPARSLPPKALQAWLDWYASTPDTPCIAICSTSQGDAVCKGCGRSFAEVQHWPGLSPFQKRACWLRIAQQGTALRFTTYAERAGSPSSAKK